MKVTLIINKDKTRVCKCNENNAITCMSAATKVLYKPSVFRDFHHPANRMITILAKSVKLTPNGTPTAISILLSVLESSVLFAAELDDALVAIVAVGRVVRDAVGRVVGDAVVRDAVGRVVRDAVGRVVGGTTVVVSSVGSMKGPSYST